MRELIGQDPYVLSPCAEDLRGSASRGRRVAAPADPLGWHGTERVVFARHVRAEELDWHNVWASVRILGPRYVRLTLLPLPAVLPTIVAAIAWGSVSWSTRIVTATTIGVVVATLTFVTPALALSTSEARSAFVIGWRCLEKAGHG